ncbi:MAG: Transcriptional regulator, LysR family [Sphingomonas bacterium]|jgi:DNA-binding transcriptional LysR family regulator|nr:Transcriptional regulator, LysR family [Sphingomonas bacterium]MDB5717190.1 Transcriptional regulator, LysR family [Sphingomonas bacterium]
MSDFTLEQIVNFLAVADHGGFSAAARSRNRAQPALTYSIQKMETQIGSRLFDRSGYRPVLTDAGRALLPQARRVVEQAGLFSCHAGSIAAGLEQELSIVIDPICPAPLLIKALKAFQQHYPSVQTSIYTEVLDGVTRHLVDGTCAIGILSVYSELPLTLHRASLLDVELLLVAAPSHPLAQTAGPLSSDLLRDHVQLVLMDKAGFAGVRDHAILGSRLWRLGDLTAMLSMLRAGLGYAIMPDHLAREDIDAGRLTRLRPSSWGVSASIPVTLCAAWRVDPCLGPAAQWLLDHLRSAADPATG